MRLVAGELRIANYQEFLVQWYDALIEDSQAESRVRRYSAYSPQTPASRRNQFTPITLRIFASVQPARSIAAVRLGKSPIVRIPAGFTTSPSGPVIRHPYPFVRQVRAGQLEGAVRQSRAVDERGSGPVVPAAPVPPRCTSHGRCGWSGTAEVYRRSVGRWDVNRGRASTLPGAARFTFAENCE